MTCWHQNVGCSHTNFRSRASNRQFQCRPSLWLTASNPNWRTSTSSHPTKKTLLKVSSLSKWFYRKPSTEVMTCRKLERRKIPSSTSSSIMRMPIARTKNLPLQLTPEKCRSKLKAFKTSWNSAMANCTKNSPQMNWTCSSWMDCQTKVT